MSSPTERVGRYQLLDPIGVGPNGTVSRAKVFGVAGFERQFAIKRFHPEITASAQLAQALSGAARAYGGLEHPRIARMSEFGVAQGTTFTAVEHVLGLDAMRLVAEARLAGVPLAAGGALALVSQAARAIGYAHGRGLTHLGLSPTNVLVNAEGDIKITDFGILAATLPARPIDVPRLAARIGYLAPEQLANEATSAATDVFALGVLAYELVSGESTFKGETPQQVAQAVMTGPSKEPPLPRPIVRVLQRCVARSPFERFPDARAFADALDAALRVAPVPGTRKDIGALVKQTLDRLEELHSGELSGMVALNIVNNAALRAAAPVATLGQPRESQIDLATTEFVRPDTPVAGPTPLVGPKPTAAELPSKDGGNTVPELPKMPMQTVPGLAPPPIPVPKGVAGPSAPAAPAAGGASTLLGLPTLRTPTPTPTPSAGKPLGIPPARPATPAATKTPTLPSIVPPAPGATPAPAVPLDRPSETPVSPLKVLESMPSGRAPVAAPVAPAPSTPRAPVERPSETPVSPLRAIEAMPGGRAPVAAPVPELDLADAEIATLDPAELQDAPSGLLALDDLAPPPPGARPNNATNQMSAVLVEQLAEQSRASSSLDSLFEGAGEQPHAFDPMPTPIPVLPAQKEHPTIPSLASGLPSRQYPVDAVPAGPQQHVATTGVRAPASRKRAPWILGGVAAALVLGGGGFVGYTMITKSGESSGTATAPADAAKAGSTDAVVATREPADATGVTTTADAEAQAAPDAAVALAGDAGAPPADAPAVAQVDAGAGPGPASTDTLSIVSTPPGARVYLDGADAGTTPLKLPGTPDKHTIAVFLPGHELYVAHVDGHGAFSIPLKEVTPDGGPAGIKVTRCKAKDRYYVFVDGKPTGMTCPTERIETEIGPHVVEVYDLVTESRRKWEIEVKDTRLSVRVKVD